MATSFLGFDLYRVSRKVADVWTTLGLKNLIEKSVADLFTVAVGICAFVR